LNNPGLVTLSLNTSVTILDFFAMVSAKQYVLEELCSDGSEEQLFFKYFPIHTLVVQKVCTGDVVCSRPGLNELNAHFYGARQSKENKQ
jgi:hypothetical protein